MFTEICGLLDFLCAVVGMLMEMDIPVRNNEKGLELIFSSSLIDIAIGAFKSNQAAVLRSRPVIQVVGSVRTTRKTINLDEKQCVTEFGKMPWF